MNPQTRPKWLPSIFLYYQELSELSMEESGSDRILATTSGVGSFASGFPTRCFREEEDGETRRVRFLRLGVKKKP